MTKFQVLLIISKVESNVCSHIFARPDEISSFAYNLVGEVGAGCCVTGFCLALWYKIKIAPAESGAVIALTKEVKALAEAPCINIGNGRSLIKYASA